MEDLQDLLARNERWARRVIQADPDFFKRLVAQQSPQYLWIGCSDSRVPANQIVDLDPGELFVHRNVGNVVPPADVNAHSVIQFAVQVLGVRHIMVVGHYRCGAIHAALNGARLGGLCDHWLGHIREVIDLHAETLAAEPVMHRREALLCELNVLEQVIHVAGSTAVTDAWAREQPLTVHGWVYKLGDGRLRHLDISIRTPQELSALRPRAVEAIVEARRAYYQRRHDGR